MKHMPLIGNFLFTNKYIGVILYQRSTRSYGVMVSMFDFHRSDRGSNPGRGMFTTNNNEFISRPYTKIARC